MFLSTKEVSFWFSPGFIRRFGFESLEFLDLIPFSLILAWNPKINRDSSSLSSSLVQNLRLRSLFFSDPRLCDRIRVCCFLRRIWCLNCRGTRLNDEDSIESLKATQTPLILAWIASGKLLGFSEMFFSFLSLLWSWSNWMEREICELFVTWRWFCGPLPDLYSGRPYIGCHVASEPIGTWHVDWYLLAWHLDLTVKKKPQGLKCN